MTLLYTIREAENKLILLCCNCKTSVGIVTYQEAAEYSIAGIQPLCFDCGPDNPDIVPIELVEFTYRWFLHIGELVFVCDWDCKVNEFKQQNISVQKISLLNYFFLKTSWRDKNTPLASTLNLNKEPMEKASFLVIDGEIS